MKDLSHSQNDPVPLTPTPLEDASENAGLERTREQQLRHDIRHALYAIQLAAELMQAGNLQESDLPNVGEILLKETGQIRELLPALLEEVRINARPQP